MRKLFPISSLTLFIFILASGSASAFTIRSASIDAGGIQLTVKGTGFPLTPPPAIVFNGVKLTDVSVSPDKTTVTAPVTVTVPGNYALKMGTLNFEVEWGVTGPQGPVGATGATGTAGPQGPQGPAAQNGAGGANCNIVLSGSAYPVPDALGNDGDFYLNTATNNLYGPKAGGVWPSAGIDLTGPARPQGVQGAQGIQGPTGAAGPQGP